MAPALMPEALPGTLCTTLYTGLHILIFLMWDFGTSFIDYRGAVSGGLAQPVRPLWELGQTEVFLSVCPLP